MAVDAARAKSLFLAASDLVDPAERAAYLERACGGDAELRQRVEALLAAHEASGSLLGPMPGSLEQTVDSEPMPVRPGATGEYRPQPDGAGPQEAAPSDYRPDVKAGLVIAGRYALVEKIGEGGMGEVWVAKQTEPVKRKVALKLIKTGMDSRAVLARFELERQALALMDHPHIARVLDGGLTPTGQPYFVMELVNGLPLNKFCDEMKLTPKQRLELFVPICQAVQHAHQKGIVHRDLKPANILVTQIDGRPVPKVIDFGVAKATAGKLTEESMSTQFGAVVGTLEYMAPEQADFSGVDIDTRADIYSLGVVLYELLTGLKPHDSQRLRKAALTEMLRIVQEEEPSKPSTRLSTEEALSSLAALRQTEPKKLVALLRGELDWVVMKCLEKGRDRRYETANALARDIQRYLADEVVEARPPSMGYRASKFVRRHKGQVIAASLVLLVLLAGIAGTTWGLIVARAETAEKDHARAAEANRVKERDEALGKRDAALSEVKHANDGLNKANDELTHRLGVSAMVLANTAYDSRDYNLAAERLDQVPEKQRGWEWHYLKRQVQGGIFTLYGHTGPVTSAAFSPDGTQIVTGGGNERKPFEAKVWDARTGMFLFDLKGLPPNNAAFGNGEDGFVSVAFSADSKRILTAGCDNTARVWDAATGALLLKLTKYPGEIKCAAFSPDGTEIATVYPHERKGGVIVWDATTGKTVREWKASAARVAFSLDGTRILTRSSRDHALQVWDAKTGTLLLDAKRAGSYFGGAAFSPDGKRMIAGREDGTARVMDATTGKLLLELKGHQRPGNAFRAAAPYGVLSMAFSPDGTRIVTGGTLGTTHPDFGQASVWDARTGAELLQLTGHTGTVMSAAFSPDGTRIITGSLDGTAKVWDARTGTPRLELDGIKSPMESAAFSLDGTHIVTGGGAFGKPGEAAVWDARTGLLRLALKGFKGRVKCVAISKDGTRIVTGSGSGEEWGNPRARNGEATVWDAHTGAPLVELKGLKEWVNSVAVSADGTRIVTGAACPGEIWRPEVKVWDVKTGTIRLDLTPKSGRTPVGGGWAGAMANQGERGVSVAFSPDGRRFVVGARPTKGLTVGRAVQVLDVETGTVLVEMKGSQSLALSVAFSPDGTQIASGTSAGAVTVWDAEKGTVLLELKGHTANVNSVAFSPDGKRIVTGSADRTVRVWDVRTGTTLAELRGHADAVTSVSFSANGTRVLTASGLVGDTPGEVFVWDARTGKEPPDEEELAYRRLHTQPNPSRYRAGYLAARAVKDDFAARFYLDRLIEYFTSENKPDEVKKWQSERAKYPAGASPSREKK